MGGVYASVRLSFRHLGKTSRRKPRRKPESGKPTFRDRREARGNVTLSFRARCARLGSIPTTSGSVSGSGRDSPGRLGGGGATLSAMPISHVIFSVHDFLFMIPFEQEFSTQPWKILWKSSALCLY